MRNGQRRHSTNFVTKRVQVPLAGTAARFSDPVETAVGHFTWKVPQLCFCCSELIPLVSSIFPWRSPTNRSTGLTNRHQGIDHMGRPRAQKKAFDDCEQGISAGRISSQQASPRGLVAKIGPKGRWVAKGKLLTKASCDSICLIGGRNFFFFRPAAKNHVFFFKTPL